MIKLSIKVWEIPTEKFLDSTLALCQETIFGELHRAFGRSFTVFAISFLEPATTLARVV